MKRLFLYTMFLCALTMNVVAQNILLHVGQVKRLTLPAGAQNANWSSNGGYLSISALGDCADVTATQYFGGIVTITCKYQYRVGSGHKNSEKKFTVECFNNHISIIPTSMTLNVGQEGQLSYKHSTPNEYVKYSNAYFSVAPQYSHIVSVTRDGIVKAKAPGTALVNVYSKITDDAPYCTITVKEAKATSVSLQEKLDLYEGQTFSLSPTVKPTGATAKFTWSSDNTDIVKVSSDGSVTALKHGTANITVSTDNGLSATSKITVFKGPEQIQLIPATVTLYIGYGYRINPILVPEDSKTYISVKSSDISTATFTDSYFITGVKPGEATVTVRSSNGKEATCKIKVVETKSEYQGNAVKEKTKSLDNLMQKTLNKTNY